MLSPMTSFSQHFSADSCHHFLKGRFIVEGKEYIKIKRTDRYQYERDTKSKTKSKYRIKWIDVCAYTLTLVRTTDKDRIARDKIGVAQPHIIRNINGTRYGYASNFSFLSADVCGTMTRFEKKEETLIKVR